MADGAARPAVERLLDGIEARDVRRIRAALAPEVTWQNVPHPAAVGRDAVVALLAGIVTWSDEVRWEVTSAAYADDIAWLERVDRFVIGGAEHAVACNGVVTVDGGHVRVVRDYVDLGEWRARIQPVLDEMGRRPAGEVVARHLAAVERREPAAMAADYDLAAVLVRGTEEHRGWDAIADYFDSVPGRMRDRQFQVDEVTTLGPESVAARWRITDRDEAIVISGTDHYAVDAGRIVRQVVRLDGRDFD